MLVLRVLVGKVTEAEIILLVGRVLPAAAQQQQVLIVLQQGVVREQATPSLVQQ
jgi:ABC-type histidine transport system ATPase subunit